MKKQTMKTLLIVISFIFTMLLFQTESHASNEGFKSFNNAPRIKISTGTSSLSDIVINVVDTHGIKSVKITKKDGTVLVNDDFSKQEVNSETSTTNTTNTTENTTGTEKIEYEKKLTYTLSHNKQLNDKDVFLNIEAVDGTGLKITKQVKATVKENSKGEKYYSLNRSPGISNFAYQGAEVFSYKIDDNSKIAKTEVKNTITKQVTKQVEFSSGEENNTIATSTSSSSLDEENLASATSQIVYVDISEEKKKEDTEIYSFSITATDQKELRTTTHIQFKTNKIKVSKVKVEEGQAYLELKLDQKIDLKNIRIYNEENKLIAQVSELGEDTKIPLYLTEAGTEEVKVKVVADYTDKDGKLVQIINKLSVDLSKVSSSSSELTEWKTQWKQDGTYDKMDSKRVKVLQKAFLGVGKIQYKAQECSLTENTKKLSASGFVGWSYKWTVGSLDMKNGQKDLVDGTCKKVKKIASKDRLPGDICVVKEDGKYTHVGIYVGEKDGKMVFVHCCGCHEGVVVNSEERFQKTGNYWCRYTGFKDKTT